MLAFPRSSPSILLVLIGALLVARPAVAEFLAVDLVSPGDALITRDTVGGLDWLDVTATRGLSMTAVLGGAGGWVNDGWRYATQDELCAMWTRLFELVASPPCNFAVGHQETSRFLAFFGVGEVQSLPTATAAITEGFFVDNNPADPFQGVALVIDEDPGFVVGHVAGIAPDSLHPNATIGSVTQIGSFLVRRSPVDVPALGPLATIALALGLLLAATGVGCRGSG